VKLLLFLLLLLVIALSGCDGDIIGGIAGIFFILAVLKAIFPNAGKKQDNPTIIIRRTRMRATWRRFDDD